LCCTLPTQEGDVEDDDKEAHDYELTHVHLLRAYERLRDDVVVRTRRLVSIHAIS